MPAASTTMLSVQVSDFEDIRLLIQHRRLVCDFCSSGQRFAFGFLQIPPRDGHPCRSANCSPCRASRGLSPPSTCALPGARKKNPAEAGLLLLCVRVTTLLPNSDAIVCTRSWWHLEIVRESNVINKVQRTTAVNIKIFIVVRIARS